MSCALIAGYTIDCRDAVGGIDAIYFAEFADITAVDASGTVTGITKATGKRFWKFDVPTKSSANATSNPVGSTENGTLFFEQSIDFPVNKRDATTRNIVTTLAKNRVVAVTKDKDGTYRMYFKGYGGYLGSSTGQTGAAAGDANGYILKIEGQEKEDFFVVANAVGLALETPG
jgi:outer membrane protein assembly factor BamB